MLLDRQYAFNESILLAPGRQHALHMYHGQNMSKACCLAVGLYMVNGRALSQHIWGS